MKPLVDRPTGGVQSGRSLLVRAVAGCVLDRGPLRRAAPGPMPGSRKRARSRARLAARRPGQGRIRPPERSALAKRFTFRLGLLGLRARRSDALLYSTEVQQRTRTTAHLDDHHRTVDQGELLPTKGRQVVRIEGVRGSNPLSSTSDEGPTWSWHPPLPRWSFVVSEGKPGAGSPALPGRGICSSISVWRPLRSLRLQRSGASPGRGRAAWGMGLEAVPRVRGVLRDARGRFLRAWSPGHVNVQEPLRSRMPGRYLLHAGEPLGRC